LQIDLNKDFKFKEDNTKSEFLAKFPVGKFLSLRVKKETCLKAMYCLLRCCSQGIFRSFGKNCLQKAQVIQYMHFVANEIVPLGFKWLIPLLGYIPFDAKSVEEAKEAMKVPLGHLNQMLSNKAFLVGESITLADIVCACDLYWLMQYVMDAEYRKPFGNVVRWFETVVNQENFKAVAGKFEFCSKALTEPKKP
jgi:elongation factor 1-gamma